MNSLLLFMLTSWLVLLQESHGLPAPSPEPDAEFLEEALADGFIVATKTEKAQENHDAVIPHDSQNPGANRSQFHKDNLPMVTKAKTPEATSELTKNENAAVRSIQPTALFLESELEGSGGGVFPDTAIEELSMIPTVRGTLREVDANSEGSGMFSETLDEKRDKDLTLTAAPITHTGKRNISKHRFDLPKDDKEAEFVSEGPLSNQLTTPGSVIVEEDAVVEHKTNDVAAEKPVDKEPPQPKSRLVTDLGNNPKPVIKEGTPGWLLILALCLTLIAVICAFVAIATKDMWYGPSRQSLNVKSTESKKEEECNKDSALTLSDKEKVALMSIQNNTDSAIIGIDEEAPEKEYLM